MRIGDKYGKTIQLKNLGNGLLYDGGLKLENGECWLTTRHVVQDGHVVTYAVLKKKVGDADEISKQYGILYDKDWGYMQDIVTAYYDSSTKTYKGRSMDENGLIDMSNDPTGNTVFILKDDESGYNNVNSLWMDVSTWKNNQFIAGDVGEIL